MATTRETAASASSGEASASPGDTDDDVTERLAPVRAPSRRASVPSAPATPAPASRNEPGETTGDGGTASRQVDGQAPPSTDAAPGTGPTRPQKVAVPERPKLAPGVRLAGQMQESAFKSPPWLIEREGAGYVQITELLYRIAEQCDGQHTLSEIADAVSEQTGRSVSADNVKVLVGTQLLTKGLVATADGRVVGGAGARSLLALSMRNKVIGPELLDAPAAVLQWLFWPPVLIGLVALAIGSLGWLLLVHGLAAGGRQALYQPGLLLIALGLTALAAGFHELGHAAALRYGGGRPKGMGVGLYLVYPAFYTDVSDNYRLPRWSRVRTDLGGVLFHLVFVLGIIGLYIATGWELVLVAVPLLLLDAFRQLMPFIRLDGYWTLADITGVPDFLSYIGAFVRRLLPGHDPKKASKLPELKWWGTAAFAAYLSVALPVLAFSIFTMVRTAPTVLATGWDSASKHAGALGQASQTGNPLAMATAAVQLLILALPTVGLVYSLGRFGKRIGCAIWRWSSPTPARRLTGGLGTLGVVCLVGYLWAPQLPFIGKSGPLYQPTRASFAPIPEDSRGTLFDAVGVPQPVWTTGATGDDRALPAPSPSPVLPGSGAAPSSGPSADATATAAAQPTAEATGTAEATQTAGATLAATAVPAASTPIPTTAPTRPVSAPAQATRAPVIPAATSAAPAATANAAPPTSVPTSAPRNPTSAPAATSGPARGLVTPFPTPASWPTPLRP
jgi:putative peptide zinc metalloprotease protein